MSENREQHVQKTRALETATAAAAILDNKKALDVTTIEVGSQTILADYFVLATGTSNTHVRALADELEFKLNEDLGLSPNHIEGADGNMWILLDYGSVVVHIFTAQGRDFYKLERLWSGELKQPEIIND